MLRVERHCYRDSLSEETIITRLCDNVLLEILSYLNASGLKNASLVCRRWNELVGSSTITMEKFQFHIRNEMIECKNFGSNRNHRNYVIHTEESTDWTRLADNIELNRVRTFHIRRSRFCTTISREVMEFLSRLTELKKLTLEGVRLTVTEKFVHRIKLPKLRSLRIDGDDFTILEHIDAEEVQHLRCIGKSKINSKDFESLAQTIVRFSHLKHLTLWNCMETFEYIDVHETSFPSKLNSIEVYHINVSPIDVSSFAENLRQFLLLLTDSLRDLKFDFSMLDVEEGQKIVNDFLRIAINKCTNLTSLDIRNLSISRDDILYQSLSPNHSLTDLKVHWNFDGDVIDGLLRNCPKLKRLETEFCCLSSDAISSIASLCRELIRLDAFQLKDVIDADTIFENLKYLSIYKIENNFDPLLSLVVKCPVIQQIRICESSIADTFPVDIIIQQPSLRKLIINDKCFEIYTADDKLRIIRQSQFQDY